MVPGRQSSALLVVDESSAGGLCREGRRVPGVNACDRSEWPGYPQTQTPGDPRMQRNPLAANERDFVHERMSADRAVASSEIARELGRYPSTISREVTRNGGRHDYRPSTAGDAAEERRRRPKIPVLAVEGPLRTMVVGLVSKGFSPVATAALCDREPDPDGGVRGDDLQGRLRRHTRPQSDRMPPVPTAASQEAQGDRVDQAVNARSECGADQRTRDCCMVW